MSRDTFKRQAKLAQYNHSTPGGARQRIMDNMAAEIVAAQAGWRPKDLERERKLWVAENPPERWPDRLRRRRKELEAQGVVFLCAAR